MQGFSAAKVLAKKMIAIMELSQQQLSKQDHYDYGLRSVPWGRPASLPCVAPLPGPWVWPLWLPVMSDGTRISMMCGPESYGPVVPIPCRTSTRCRSFVIPIARAAGSLKRADPDAPEEVILYRWVGRGR
jgi:hypothetical protein